jgi:Flp pilus assembly pilin Flp
MHFLTDTRGGEIPEWAGIVGLLALVLVGGFTIFRNQLNGFFRGLFGRMGI